MNYKKIKNMAKSTKRSKSDIIKFHKEVLVELVDIYIRKGIDTVQKVKDINGKSKLEDSLWKIPEAGGKYNQRYISEGVKSILDDIAAPYNYPNDNFTSAINKFLKSSKDSIQLEHVVEKAKIIELIFDNPSNTANIVDKYNIGCTVLKSEHGKLPNNLFAKDDVWIRYKRAGIKVWDRKDKKFM
jgi:hypothetical protein